MKHQITKSLVKGSRTSTLRARCSCGDFTSDVPRLSTPGRRKQNRLIAEHLTGPGADPAPAAALLNALTIEGVL